MINASNLNRYINDLMPKLKYFGLFFGKVENNCDPKQMGRIQVRIHHIKGFSNEGISSDVLKWAVVANQGPGSWDTGSFNPPNIGDYVIVGFVAGEPDSAVILGTWQGMPKEVQEYGRLTETGSDEQVPPYEVAMETWKGKTGVELPRETQLIRNTDPTRRVIFKTAKGAALYIDEIDEGEFLEMVDRSGQGITMHARVLKELNRGNAEQRGIKTVFNGDQIRYTEKIQDREVYVRLNDLLNQGVLIQGRRGEERVKLQSKQPDFSEAGYEEADLRDMHVGKERQTFEINAGHGYCNYEGVQNGSIKIRVRYDANRPLVEIEAMGEDSIIVINGKRLTIGSDTITIEGSILLDGDVLIAGDLTCTGEIIEGKKRDEGSVNYR